MRTYTKLLLPEDSAWDRKTWRKYTHWRLKYFVDSICNIVRWVPVLYKDRDWDDYYITKILQKKIEHQRAYLVKQNRHTRVDEDNFWMTVVLNLIEREHENYYALEKYDYEETDIKFVESPSHIGSYEMVEKVIKSNLDEYLHKYPAAIRRVMKRYPDNDFGDKKVLAFYVGMYNQERCRNLLFEILKRYSNRWWD